MNARSPQVGVIKCAPIMKEVTVAHVQMDSFCRVTLSVVKVYPFSRLN